MPQVPLGNAANGLNKIPPGMGAKVLLNKKLMKANSNPTYVSPTDYLMTPCSQKISAAKKKHFNSAKAVAPLAFGTKEEAEDDIEMHAESENPADDPALDNGRVDTASLSRMDEENPF